MSKPNIQDIKFKIVPPEYVQGFIDYEKAPIVQALIEGSIILVPFDTSLYKIFQFLRSKELYKIHKRKIEEGLLVWITINEDGAPKS